MYARFFTKALKNLELSTLTNHFKNCATKGLFLAEDGSKMSKSKGNVINPDDVIERFGADSAEALRDVYGPARGNEAVEYQNILGVSEDFWKGFGERISGAAPQERSKIFCRKFSYVRRRASQHSFRTLRCFARFNLIKQ
jgi:cysteinyl-tRNA synthetase